MKTIYQQTGWKRPFHQTICQDFDVLKLVTDYSFDVNNHDFLVYAKKRGVLYKAGRNKRFAFTANHSATKAEFFDLFRFAEQQADGSRYRFSDDEMEIHWGIMIAAKGAMQDCWELFEAHK